MKLLVGFLLVCSIFLSTFADDTTVRWREYNNRNTRSARFIREGPASSNSTCELLFWGPTQQHRGVDEHNPVVLTTTPLIRPDDHHHTSDTNSLHVFEVFALSESDLQRAVDKMCATSLSRKTSSEPKGETTADEVVALVKSGEAANRVDVVLMGDGYTQGERDKFFDDMKRLTNDLFQKITFASYLPVFNVWALFRPSKVSGIGSNGVPRDTSFGLYRDGTELRGVYTSKAAAARSACQATGVCDFPSLIGNDPYYGGLGGEFTITTSSPQSGTIVLRHEMGHNFGSVGEEYDGGYVYSGANAIRSPSSVTWAHWLNDPTIPATPQRSIQRFLSYAWYNLANGPLNISFTSNGAYSRGFLRFSASGCEAPGSLKVLLDGVELPWTPQVPGSLDRLFYEYQFEGFKSGRHVISFVSGFPPTAGPIRQLCNANLNEYGPETTYKFDNSYIGVYPTWDINGRLSYRPNNERCLMRNMTSEIFCVVCQENMWHQFFQRISLIDALTTSTQGDSVTANLTVIPLAQFRTKPIPGEKYLIKWLKAGVEDTTVANLVHWTKPKGEATGQWEVQVEFQTPEVRRDPRNFLKDKQSFRI